MPQPASALSPQSDPINSKTASVVHPREWMPCPSCPLCSGVPKTRHFTSYKQATDHELRTTVGRSVASAFERMYHLERACTMQVRTRMLGPTAYPIEKAVVDQNEAFFHNPERMEMRSTNLVW